MTELRLDAKIHGFNVKRIRESKELNGRLVEMVFEKTGTELVWVDNKVENKLFAIGFKTVPYDSTGVFHILEHSVLCGSKKFPVKEPFVELLKSSMNTFLNAMTYPDKTVYPVSSRNTKDFLNLTEVYLDAVFCPMILENPNIFYQEGWHIEKQESGEYAFNGVVYNEMKGAMSGIDGAVREGLLKYVFPDTCYRHNSGGEPANIPDLSYEKFKETYKKFYSPSNAKIFLDGDVPIDTTLELIESYLNEFERENDLPVIEYQKPVKIDATNSYEIDDADEIENHSQLTLAKIIGTWADTVKQLEAKLLCHVLTGTNDSPLIRPLLDAGLAEDMLLEVNDEIAQTMLTIEIKNIKDGAENEILELIKNTAKKIAEEGVDRDQLKSAISASEFATKTPSEPQALSRMGNAFRSWLYGGDPILYLESDGIFDAVKADLETDAYEKLLVELLVEEEGRSVLLTKPSKTLTKEKQEEEAARVRKITDKWSDAEKQENALLNAGLNLWHETPDSEEAIRTLPTLSLEDIDKTPVSIPTTEEKIEGVTVLRHKVPANGIVHENLFFELDGLTLEEAVQVSRLDMLLTCLPTKKYDLLTLNQKLDDAIGNLSFSISGYSPRDQKDKFCPMLIVRFSTFEKNIREAEELILEVLLNTDFSAKESIRELVLQSVESAKEFPVMSGHSLGNICALSHYSSKNAFREALAGVSQIAWIKDFAKNFDDQIDAFSELLESKLKAAITKENLVMSITTETEIDPSEFIKGLPSSKRVKAEPMTYKANLPMNMAYKIPAPISFAVQAGNISEFGGKYSGSLRVLSNIVTFSYLWNMVRVNGGAYGTGISVKYDGDMCTYSYRDPNPKNALDTNLNISKFIKAFAASDEEIDKFIISSVSSMEPLMSPRAKGAMGDEMWFRNITPEDRAKEKAELLATTKETLLSYCDMLDRFANEGAKVVVGGEEALKDFPNFEVVTSN